MKKITTVVIIALLFAGVAIYNFFDMGGNDAKKSPASASLANFKPKSGELTPPQMLPDLNDNEVAFGSTQPQVQLINFWASWCGPCELEAPDLQKLHEKYGESLAMYGVNATHTDRERQARQFVEDYGFTFDILFDRDGDVTNLYSVRTFPTSFLIDKDGVIVERINGVITLEQWETIIEQYL